MDLAGISTANFGQIQHAGSILTMKKTMEAAEMQMAGVLEMMETATPPQAPSSAAFGLGQNVDIRV